ncbi:D-ornithine 4,5-aminomutase subunit OraE [Coriobacteriia bacterium Es71-Z0120]|uniref:D-ornithine 4,5-aminomutase subunit OraE n=1 Tax=Parvivirga hydrogeniphila TaxID=2939460 RepID=UPI002260E902|nr:D-ornithine 4,5-aminomutase subunit OraE [Parvivirga hydrogeniphila]MCL4078117.1 D-ornithine 4,5-aminomutase subunit OraE [Parvivirga hydrogeniphila]
MSAQHDERFGAPLRDPALDPNAKLDVEALLAGLDRYRPRRRGWTWRRRLPAQRLYEFEYRETSEPLARGVPLPAARYFEGIDPQPDCVITTEIASGRPEDDVRRMRMAAWHGADHIMVIRTAGQSHMDGLIEGTPEGVGGTAVTRKQVRLTRRALDLIEDEVGRPIDFHSYVSGVAGPEIAVMFAEEGVNGAHQDPQYNVLYRNINMYRSFVDAAEAKRVMAHVGMLQIDGAHNANATAVRAWKVMPELLVQHAINCAYSEAVGMPRELIALSTVPPDAPPAPCIRMDLPYAIALRDLFRGFKMRAQQNTRYMESDAREATVSHVLNMVISRLTSADIQSTITPDEGRNVPWHYNNVAAVDTAKQALVGMDGLREMVRVDREAPELKARVRELKERAVLFLEAMLRDGGYFAAVEQAYFVDSGEYPETNDDGIARASDGGVAAGTIVKRAEDYLAPVCAHFGENHLELLDLPEGVKPCDAVGGCTLCDDTKVPYIDELDPDDNAAARLAATRELRERGLIKPEVEWTGDGIVVVTMFLPASEQVAKAAALELGRAMNLVECEVIHSRVMHPAEGTLVELKGRLEAAVDPATLVVPEPVPALSDEEIREFVREHGIKAVAATVGNDEHSVGMREIIDIKHGGLEKWGFTVTYLGTSVPVDKLLDAAIEHAAQVVLVSTIITHADVHREMMRKLADLAVEKGVRQRLLLIAGGTQVTDEMARECGMDAGFGRGTHGIDVASFIVRAMRERGM